MKKGILVIILILILSACQPLPTTQPTILSSLTPVPGTIVQPTIADTILPTMFPAEKDVQNCSVASLFEELKSQIPCETFTLSYATSQGITYLFFWIGDPTIDVQAKGSDLNANFDLAVKHAIELAQKLNLADSCTAKLFDAINPIVVDRNYNGWFSGLIKIKDMPTNAVLTEDDISNIKSSIFTLGAWQRKTVTDIQELPSASCSWNEVRENVARHFNDAPLNAYMLVADNNGLTFTVQNQAVNKDDEITVLLNTAREVVCIQTPVQMITVI